MDVGAGTAVYTLSFPMADNVGNVRVKASLNMSHHDKTKDCVGNSHFSSFCGFNWMSAKRISIERQSMLKFDICRFIPQDSDAKEFTPGLPGHGITTSEE